MRVSVCGAAGLLAGALLASPTLAQQVVVQPDWRQQPSAEDMAEAFPPIAHHLEIPGRALIACEVDARGLLRDCEVTGEAPKGPGFGVAALMLAPIFRMEPLRVAGQPVAGGRVQIPIRFTLPKPESVIVGRPTSPEALTLARRYVEVGARAEVMEEDRDVIAREIEALPVSLVARETSRAAGAAIREAIRALRPDLREALARLYAARHSAAVLTGLLRRADARRARVDDWDVTMEALSDAYNASLAMRAGDIFCADRPCGETRPPPIPLTVERR